MRITVSDLLGSWALTRDIAHADGQTAQFYGQACWSADGDGALYTETVHLHMPGQGVFAAERRYRLDAGLRVYFEDGRFFHQMPEAGGAASHWCDPDQYDAEYDFTGWPDWSCIWRVRGPRKDYRMISRYRRTAA